MKKLLSILGIIIIWYLILFVFLSYFMGGGGLCAGTHVIEPGDYKSYQDISANQGLYWPNLFSAACVVFFSSIPAVTFFMQLLLILLPPLIFVGVHKLVKKQ